jgi:hypothetical protein
MDRQLFREQYNKILPINVGFIYALLNECVIRSVLQLTFVKAAPVNKLHNFIKQ